MSVYEGWDFNEDIKIQYLLQIPAEKQKMFKNFLEKLI